MKAEGAIID